MPVGLTGEEVPRAARITALDPRTDICTENKDLGVVSLQVMA